MSKIEGINEGLFIRILVMIKAKDPLFMLLSPTVIKDIWDLELVEEDSKDKLIPLKITGIGVCLIDEYLN